MLIAAAVCPHPPLLIPAAIGSAASDPPAALGAVRDACDVAVRALAAAEPDLIAVVGGGPAGREYETGAAGSLGDYGIPVTVGEGEPVLPLSLTVGCWLLDQAGVGPGPGRRDPGRPERESRPPGGARDVEGAPDPRAQDYDEEVAEALAAADARWLGRLDTALDDELMVAGRAAWQVLAGAAAGTRLCGRLLCMASPYGVTYLVASWSEPWVG